MATFATRLKQLRAEKGLSQPQLAEQIGLTKQTISLWERGERRPNFETMVSLAEYFKVNLKYIIGTSDDPAPQEFEDSDGAVWDKDDTIHELESIFEQIAQLSEDTRKIIAGAVREAHRLDKLAGRLGDGYVIDVRLKDPLQEEDH